MSLAIKEKARIGGGRGEGEGGGGWGDERYHPLPVSTGRLGLWLFLGAISMFFAAFASAYLVRRSSPDWLSFSKPPILAVNTILLLISTLLIYSGQRKMVRGDRPSLLRWLGSGTILGLLFLVGQWFAWMQLRHQGVFLPTNPSSSFFYLLTGAHGLHLIGGLVLLSALLIKASVSGLTTRLKESVDLTATYWHCLTIVWLMIFLLLMIG